MEAIAWIATLGVIVLGPVAVVMVRWYRGTRAQYHGPVAAELTRPRPIHRHYDLGGGSAGNDGT